MDGVYGQSAGDFLLSDFIYMIRNVFYGAPYSTQGFLNMGE